MKKSLQSIEDYYYQKGLRGSMLRRATENDREYIKILKERLSKVTKKFPIKPGDRKKYNLAIDQDYEILKKVYELEKEKLSKNDKLLVKLIKTQLEHHWRVPIVKFLNQMLKKYR